MPSLIEPDGEFRRVTNSLDRERYQEMKSRVAEKLATWTIPYPCVNCCDGTYLGHFLKYAERY